MKTSDKLRAAFKRFEGGKKWWGACSGLDPVQYCAATACKQPGVGDAWEDRDAWAHSAEVTYLYKALPRWTLIADVTRLWRSVAAYNDDPRCEFRHISALYGKAIKLAEIDEAESAGLIGKARLLRVALALREAKNPKFDMQQYRHPCGTPACAFGHYAVRTDLQAAFRPADKWYYIISNKTDFAFGRAEGATHFEIIDDEWDALFDVSGCAGAKTAIQAADFIEKFAHAKWPTV